VEQLAETLESARRQIRAHIVAQREHERALAQALDTAQQATHAKSTFLANMSHELRTPMNAILGYSELLMEDAEELGQANMLEDLRKIHAAGKHLLWLVNSILDLSKVEAGKMELYVETIDVQQFIEEVIATIQPMARKNENEIIVDIEPGIRTLDTDIVKMRQGLFNLLSNACKFTKKGTVALLVRRERHEQLYMTFSVVDTGLGITQEQLDKLFEPFSQADPSTTRLFGGTGLGLSLSRTLAEMMGGGLKAQSHEGQGSRFTLRLPIPESNDVARLPEPVAGTVLVIDDDPSVLELMERHLEKEGFNIVTASDGEEGLELARELKPLAITLDVLMPGMDGWEVLSALKADERTADIPVLMLTILEGREKGFALGAAEYLTKPIDRSRLVRALGRYRLDYGSNTVLVVEDEPEIRELMRRTLESEGWEVREASNGLEALDALAVEVPRAVLLDLMMPEMDGFQFLSEIRTNPEWGSVPVIVITAMELSIEQRRRLEVAAQRVMHKAAYSRDALLRETRLVLQNLTQDASTPPLV
jgi:CheY-like chemotaxis protein/nitrogen-specific signal transduction histidine kinase